MDTAIPHIKPQPKLAALEDDGALERLNIVQPDKPFCLTVQSEVLDAISDGRIKGRNADAVGIILDDMTNLGMADRQAVGRGKYKLRDVFGEEYRIWG